MSLPSLTDIRVQRWSTQTNDEVYHLVEEDLTLESALHTLLYIDSEKQAHLLARYTGEEGYPHPVCFSACGRYLAWSHYEHGCEVKLYDFVTRLETSIPFVDSGSTPLAGSFRNDYLARMFFDHDRLVIFGMQSRFMVVTTSSCVTRFSLIRTEWTLPDGQIRTASQVLYEGTGPLADDYDVSIVSTRHPDQVRIHILHLWPVGAVQDPGTVVYQQSWDVNRWEPCAAPDDTGIPGCLENT